MPDGVQHALHRQLSLLLTVHGRLGAVRCLVRVVAAFHRMAVLIRCIAFAAQIVVLADRAMESYVAGLPAGVARVRDLIGRERVQFDQRDHRGILGAAQRGEFAVLLAGEVQKDVARFHQVALNRWISIGQARWSRHGIAQANDEEGLERRRRVIGREECSRLPLCAFPSCHRFS